ncbi:MAG: hypothetical protein QM778_19085 [Myxococcales bacterium]
MSQAELLERVRALEAKLAELTANPPAALVEDPTLSLPLTEDTSLIEEVTPDLLKIYGYFDTGAQYLRYQDPRSFTRGFGRADGFTYQFGGLNLYFDAQPHEQFRALVETRFSLWPNGTETSFDFPSDPSIKYQRTDTSTYDTSSTTGRNKIQWSGILLERAWAQWQPRDWFNLRTGIFLTPYGIWNVDHGQPTLISMVLPEFFASEFFPTRQIGMELLGVITKGFLDIGYHFTVSNGRNFALTDVDNNKAFGGRAYLRYKNRFTLGGSWYWDHFKDIKKRVASLIPFNLERVTWFSGREYALGVDLSADIGNLRVRAEGAMQRIQYDDGFHRLTGNQPGATQPNEIKWDGYVLAAYTRPDWHIEPYLLFEAFRRVNVLSNADGVIQASGGLNVLITPRVSVKNQFSAFQFIDFAHDWKRSDKDTFFNLISRLVLAF